jgi:hypothetical protein
MTASLSLVDLYGELSVNDGADLPLLPDLPNDQTFVRRFETSWRDPQEKSRDPIRSSHRISRQEFSAYHRAPCAKT